MSRQAEDPGLAPILGGGLPADETPLGSPVMAEDWGRMPDAEGMTGTIEPATPPIEPHTPDPDPATGGGPDADVAEEMGAPNPS